MRYDLQTGAPIGLKLEPGLKLDPQLRQEPDTVAPTPPPSAKPAEVPAGASAPPVEELPAAPPPAESSGWFVQVGSFSDPVNAHGARERLKGAAITASVQEVRVGRALWYRVRAGPFPDEVAASRALRKVQALDYRGARVMRG